MREEEDKIHSQSILNALANSHAYRHPNTHARAHTHTVKERYKKIQGGVLRLPCRLEMDKVGRKSCSCEIRLIATEMEHERSSYRIKICIGIVATMIVVATNGL